MMSFGSLRETTLIVAKYAVEFYIKSEYTKGRKGECDYAKYQTNL